MFSEGKKRARKVRDREDYCLRGYNFDVIVTKNYIKRQKRKIHVVVSEVYLVSSYINRNKVGETR